MTKTTEIILFRLYFSFKKIIPRNTLKIGKMLVNAGFNPHFVSKGYSGIEKTNILVENKNMLEKVWGFSENRNSTQQNIFLTENKIINIKTFVLEFS